MTGDGRDLGYGATGERQARDRRPPEVMKGQIGDPRLRACLGPRRPKPVFRPAPPLSRRQNGHCGCLGSLRLKRKLHGRADRNEDAGARLALSQPQLFTVIRRPGEAESRRSLSRSTNPQLLQDFVAHLWSGGREPAELYIMDHGHPLILTYAQDGRYAHAMTSFDNMEALADGLAYEFDRHANMEY